METEKGGATALATMVVAAPLFMYELRQLPAHDQQQKQEREQQALPKAANTLAARANASTLLGRGAETAKATAWAPGVGVEIVLELVQRGRGGRRGEGGEGWAIAWPGAVLQLCGVQAS